MNNDEQIEQEFQKIETGIEFDDSAIKLQEILDNVEEILPGKKDMILLTLAISISHLVDHKTPLWLMFVGVPSSAKTEIARLIQYNPNVKLLDALTENAFVSGAKNKDGSNPNDLLPLLDGKCFVIKDFTTTLSQKEETVKKIIGDLTSIYDGTFEKHSPARGTVSYKSFFSILGCVTPQALNHHQRYMNQIGPRFMFYRVPRSSDEEIDTAMDIFWSSSDLDKNMESLRRKVSTYSCQLAQKVKDFSLAPESIDDQGYINDLAKFIAKARGTVLTRSAKFTTATGEEITYYEAYEIQIEEPHRALRQLTVLGRALAYISDKNRITKDELVILKKVALSSMPADRSALISVISKENRDWSAKEIADCLGISHKTASRQLDELVSLEILTKEEQGNGLANKYFVKPIFKSVVYSGAGFVSSSPTTETETPHRDNNDDFSEQVDKLFGIDSASPIKHSKQYPTNTLGV